MQDIAPVLFKQLSLTLIAENILSKRVNNTLLRYYRYELFTYRLLYLPFYRLFCCYGIPGQRAEESSDGKCITVYNSCNSETQVLCHTLNTLN